MSDPQLLQGASLDLVQSMFQMGCKAAELGRTKLQTEIQKEQSEIRRRQLEKHLAMATANPRKGGFKGGPVKNLKREKELEEGDDDRLDDLVVDVEPDDDGKQRMQSRYLNWEPGELVTKGADHKSRLDQRHARMAAAAGRPDDEEEMEETEKDNLEHEARKLSNELRRAECAEAQARDKEEREKAKVSAGEL